MSRKFEARYPGRCLACNEPIDIGDDLTYDYDQVVHYECAGRAASLATIGRRLEVCPRCFTEKSISGACACEDDT